MYLIAAIHKPGTRTRSKVNKTMLTQQSKTLNGKNHTKKQLKVVKLVWQFKNTVQKMTFPIKNFFCKCDQICRELVLVTFTEEFLNEKLRFLSRGYLTLPLQLQAVPYITRLLSVIVEKNQENIILSKPPFSLFSEKSVPSLRKKYYLKFF